MSPKAKHVLARDHLALAMQEAEEAHLGLVATLLLHAPEAAVDALAERHDIATSPTHWRRKEIIEELYKRGVLERDDGDDPDFDGENVDDVMARVEALVVAAEEAWSGD